MAPPFCYFFDAEAFTGSAGRNPSDSKVFLGWKLPKIYANAHVFSCQDILQIWSRHLLIRFFFLLINGMAVDMVLYAKKARSKGALAWRALFMATGWDVGWWMSFPLGIPTAGKSTTLSLQFLLHSVEQVWKTQQKSSKVNPSQQFVIHVIIWSPKKSIAWVAEKSETAQRLEALPRLCILNLSLFNEVPEGWESVNCLPALGLRSTIRNDYVQRMSTNGIFICYISFHLLVVNRIFLYDNLLLHTIDHMLPTWFLILRPLKPSNRYVPRIFNSRTIFSCIYIPENSEGWANLGVWNAKTGENCCDRVTCKTVGRPDCIERPWATTSSNTHSNTRAAFVAQDLFIVSDT